MDGAALEAHVNLELASGATALPAVVAIAQGIRLLAEYNMESAARSQLEVDQPGQRAAQLRKGVHLLFAEEHGDGYQRVERGQIASLDADGKEEQELHIAVEEANGHQQAKDASAAAVEKVSAKGIAQGAAGGINGGGGGRGAKDGRGIEPRNPALGMKALKKPGQEPQREQLEEGSEDTGMDEAVGKGLPDPAVQKGAGNETEAIIKRNSWMRKGRLGQQQGKEGAQVQQH